MPNSARPINELTGIKKPSSVLIRGNSHMEIAKQIGAIPGWYTEVEYVEWAKGPRGFSTFEIWQQIPGNEDKTLDDFLDFLGFAEAVQTGEILDDIADAVADATAQALIAEGFADDAADSATAAQTAETNAEAAQAAAEAAAALVVGGVLAQNAIFGLNTSRASATTIGIAVGQARASDNSHDIVVAAPLVVDLTVVGDLGRDVATALALGQSWHIHVIKNTTTSAVSAIASLSPTNPTLPAGYNKSRRIWSLPALGYGTVTPAGTDIPAYTQWGNICKLALRTADFVTQSGNSSPMLKVFPVIPLGVKLEVEAYTQLVGDGGTHFIKFRDPDLGVPEAYGGSSQWGHLRVSTNELYLTIILFEPCNTAQQIYVHVSTTAAIWAAGIRGWKDQRGAV